MENLNNEKTLEALFSELDKLISKMEKGETTLEESFGLYQDGMEMLKLCNAKIDDVEKKVLILEESGEMHEF